MGNQGRVPVEGRKEGTGGDCDDGRHTTHELSSVTLEDVMVDMGPADKINAEFGNGGRGNGGCQNVRCGKRRTWESRI